MSTKRMAAPIGGTSDLTTADTTASIPDIITKETYTHTKLTQPVQDGLDVGHPREQLELEEGAVTADNTVYPKGPKLWLTFLSLCLILFLQGIDITIVAVAVPGLTDSFKSIEDLGWYSAAYGLVLSCSVLFFGKCYTVFRTKYVYLFGIIIFELGSILCTLAPTSTAFIMGRVIAGAGSAAFSSGAIKVLRDMFPLNKQALTLGIAGGCQGIGMVSAPMIGGLLIDAFTWRGCFGINIPLCTMTIAFTAWAFQDTNIQPEFSLPLREKLKLLDLLSTALIVPAIACLLIGLQWGGMKFGWQDWRIILLFVIFGVLFAFFVYMQSQLGEKATVPPRIIKQRSILGALWFSACCNGTLAMTEYYISIYFQGVRGFSATKAGLLGVPMIVGMSVSGMLSAAGINYIGHYYPFLYATSILAPIASGLLTTVDLDGSIVKPAALLGFLGIAIGFGIQVPTLAVTTVLSPRDVTIGVAVVGFGGGLGSAVWICASATLFQNRLGREIMSYSPATNVTALDNVGLSDIRRVIGEDRLRDVLTGYNQAVVQTLYMPLALTVLTLVGSLAIERKSMKAKQS